MNPGRHHQDNPRAARCELKYPALHSGRETENKRKKEALRLKRELLRGTKYDDEQWTEPREVEL